MKKNEKFEANSFYYYANLYHDKLTEEERIRSIDVTELFWDEVEKQVINRELVNININANVRKGKSTLAIYLGQELFKLLKKHKRSHGEFTIGNIARDQIEYSRLMGKSDIHDTVIVIDEFDKMAYSGENSSVEEKLSDTISDIQAARYVHKISCSPKEVVDKNADIYIEVVATDKKRMITHCYIYYMIFKGGMLHLQILGHANFNVSSLIGTWHKEVENIFYKPTKTKEEETFIENAIKNDLYTLYLSRKHEKIDLMSKEGIFNPRLLEIAGVMLEVYNSLSKIVPYTRMTKGIIENYIRIYAQRKKIPLSIIGLQSATESVRGVLELEKELHQLGYKIGKADNNAKPYLIGLSKEVGSVQDAQISEWKRHVTIHDKYKEKLL